MKLIVPDPYGIAGLSELNPRVDLSDLQLDRAARSYGMKASPGATFDGPRPWIALEVTSMTEALPLSWLNFDEVMKGTVLVGYTPSGLPDDVLEMADMVVYIEQFDDAALMTRDQALAVFLHEAYQYSAKKRRRS